MTKTKNLCNNKIWEIVGHKFKSLQEKGDRALEENELDGNREQAEYSSVILEKKS